MRNNLAEKLIDRIECKLKLLKIKHSLMALIKLTAAFALVAVALAIIHMITRDNTMSEVLNIIQLIYMLIVTIWSTKTHSDLE